MQLEYIIGITILVLLIRYALEPQDDNDHNNPTHPYIM